MNNLVVRIQNLAVMAGCRRILKLESLHLEPGGFLGLLGPNGAGKSTLLCCLLGMQNGASGCVEVLGTSLVKLASIGLSRLRQSIGYVPQLLPVHSELPLTLREVVAIGRTGRAGLFHRLQRADWRLVDEWLERMDLGGYSGSGYSELSGGQQRKAMLARAMCQEPRLLLLDEPAANLDLGARERMVLCIHELHRQTGVTIILVCHELEALPPSCRHVVLLEDGQNIAEGDPETVFTNERIASLYGPGLRVLHRDGRHAVMPSASFEIELPAE